MLCQLTTPSSSHDLTHFPKLPGCARCDRVRGTRHPVKKKINKRGPDDRPDRFAAPTAHGQRITMDHCCPTLRNAARNGHCAVLVILDLLYEWLQSFSARDNSTYEVKKALKRCRGTIIPDRVYADGAQEYRKRLRNQAFLFIHAHPIVRRAME